MPSPTPNRPCTDLNLLFGVLALQMDLVSRDDLIAAMNAWVLAKHKPLGEVLADMGAFRDDERDLLEALVQKHLQRHGGDAEKSLAAVSSIGSVRQHLQQIADPDLNASLAHVSAARQEDADPNGTRPPTVGTPTSSGSRFRILRPHARGGLGEVFVARDEELRREVALKEIQDRYADHPESRARFVLEAEINGGLEHPGIVPVYGLGTYLDGRPYYAMRFIRGDSLQEAIQRFHAAEGPRREHGERALALRGLLGRFVDVCDAIAYAHSRGVLHRDIKPGNVMLGQYGETLVVDWGLAKVVGRPEGAAASAEGTLRPASASGSAETQAGSALGTPQYMPPEQAAGRLDELGPQSDVYSLGATLYCLLTGRAPVQGKDVGEVLRRVQRGDFPPPRQVKREVPQPLEAVCLKAMALRPEGRYPTPRPLAADIEAWLADEPVSAWREPWRVRAGRWARRHQAAVAAIAAGVLVAMLAGGTGAWWLQRQQAERQAEAARQDERLRQETYQVRKEERLFYLSDRVSALMRGKWGSVDVEEQLRLADFCQRHKNLHATSVRLYVEAFKARPELMDIRQLQLRYNGACSAALAGCRQAKDATNLGDEECSRLRKQALDWLRAELAAWAKQAEGGKAEQRTQVQQALRHWQQDTDLAGVRDAAAVAKLPEAERAGWQKLWADAAALLKKAEASGKE